MKAPVSEADLAKRLGLPRPTLRKIRADKLQEGKEWAEEGGEVHLTLQGGKKVLEAVGAFQGAEKKAGDVEQLLGLSVKDELLVLTVEGRTRNRHIVMAWVDDPAPRAELVRVQVRDNRNFVEGMRVRARHVEEDLWELVGRCPRSRRDDPMREEDGDVSE